MNEGHDIYSYYCNKDSRKDRFRLPTIVKQQKYKVKQFKRYDPQNSYLKLTNNRPLLQLIKKVPQKSYSKLQKLQQNIMMQIKDLDAHLSHKQQKAEIKITTTFIKGFIFNLQVDYRLIEKFYQCIKIQQQASHAIIQGFKITKEIVDYRGDAKIIHAVIANKIDSLNHKLINQSLHSIKQFDDKKQLQFQKNYGKRWIHSKRIKTQANLPSSYENLQSQLLINQGNISGLKKQFLQKNQSRSTKLSQSKVTSLSKVTFLSKISTISNKKPLPTLSTKTQPIQPLLMLTKQDTKKMLLSHKNIVSIWSPPVSYPQFFGLFTYKIIKVQDKMYTYRCKLDRFFFYKFGINRKIFDAIIDFIEQQTNFNIEALQINIDKILFNRIFANLGWVLKFWHSHNRVKAIYLKSTI